MFIDSTAIFYVKADVLDSVSVSYEMVVHLLAAVLVVNRGEDEGGSLVIPDDMADNLPFSRF